MLFARLRHGDFEGYGLVEDGRVQPLEGDLFGEHRPSGEALPLDSVRLLAPVARPGKILAAALNYPSHVACRPAMTGRSGAANTGTLIHGVAALIAFASRVMTLEPGDLVFTGTPGETGRLSEGDVVEVEIGGTGVLRNAVKAEAD